MDADGSLFREQDPDWGIGVPNDDLDETREEGLKRARQLGFTATQAQQIADALAGIFRDQSLTFIEYDGIAQTYWEIDDLSEENRKTLEALAQKRRPGALYALACLYRLEDPPTESDGYWFRAQQAGQMLTGAQRDLAEDYAAAVAKHAHYLSLMKQAANLAYADAAFEIAEQGGEDSLDSSCATGDHSLKGLL